MPLVSIIIPCYNQAKYLTATLDSVLSQQLADWECILVDDGATDNTEEVASRFCTQDPRFVYYKQTNQGLSAARNAGLKIAKGKYIQFLDSDDLLLSDKLQRQVEILEHSQADVAVCHHAMFTNSPEQTWDNAFSRSSYCLTTEGFLYGWNTEFIIAIHSGLFRRSFIEQHTLFFDQTVQACEDWIFWGQLSLAGACFVELQDKLALYRVHPASMTADPLYMQTNRVRAYMRFYELLPENQKPVFLQRGADNLVRSIANAARNKQAEVRAQSIDYKVGAALLRPFHILSSYTKKVFRTNK